MNRIKIDRDRVVGKLDRNVFGGLTEHYGKIIYGGLVDYNSNNADKDGIRDDVAKAFKDIGMPVIRWPGGNFSSGYHWEDGVGPIKKRPVRYDYEWEVEETNRFGTDEFVKFCRKIGTEPYICVNAGNGTAEEAAHWVEYCNIKGNSSYAKLREQNGNPGPYGIKYWGIGNELYGRGQIGRKNIEEYITCVREFSKLMKRVDPTIKLVAVGLEKTEWNYRLVKEAGEYFDYISVHSYHVGTTDEPYEKIAALSAVTEEQLYEMKCSIDSASYYIKDRKKKPIEICFDEWNLRIWAHDQFIERQTLAYDFNTYNRELVAKNSELVGTKGITSKEEMIDFQKKKRNADDDNSKITMADAIYTACVFNSVLRMCSCVTFGCFSPIINGKGLFSCPEDKIVLRPTYHVFDLYSKYTGDTVLDTYVDCGCYEVFIDSATYSTNRFFTIPYIDAVASVSDKEKKLYIAVVNRNGQGTEECLVFFEGFRVNSLKVHNICSKSVDSFNDLDRPDEVYISNSMVADVKDGLKYEFPPHSVTIIEADIG